MSVTPDQRSVAGRRTRNRRCASVDIDLPSVSAFDAEKKEQVATGLLTFADIAPAAVHRLFTPTRVSHLLLSFSREKYLFLVVELARLANSIEARIRSIYRVSRLCRGARIYYRDTDDVRWKRYISVFPRAYENVT